MPRANSVTGNLCVVSAYGVLNDGGGAVNDFRRKA